MEKLRPSSIPRLSGFGGIGRLILRDGSSPRPIAGQETRRPSWPSSTAFPRIPVPPVFLHAPADEKFITKLCDSPIRERLTLIVTRSWKVLRASSPPGLRVVEPQKAEVAVVVDDAFQGKGLATLLLESFPCWRSATASGFSGLTTPTTADAGNFSKSDSRFTSGPARAGRHRIVGVAREDSVTRSELRDRVYTTASLRPFFRPNAVAYWGLTQGDQSGFKVVESLRPIVSRSGVSGQPQGRSDLFHKGSHSFTELPEQVDLAVVVVPRIRFPGWSMIARFGGPGLDRVTAGYAEEGAEGRSSRGPGGKSPGYGMRAGGAQLPGVDEYRSRIPV